MGSQDSFFEALGGETPTGFFTHSTSISIGVDVQGNQVGVKGTCQGPVGDGVQGFGAGRFSGVAGFGGDDVGTGVVGFGGGQFGPGVRGIGGGGPDTGPENAVGVFGQGGRGSTGVIGQGGADVADGVLGIGTAEGHGVIGHGGSHTGTGVLGVGGGIGQGVRGFGAGAEEDFPGEPTGVYGKGGAQGTGVIGIAGAAPADGVRGFGSGNFSGVAGFGGTAEGTGVVGFGGGKIGTGIRGIGVGGPNTGPQEGAGVFGQGGPLSTGVIGQAGSGPADGVRGFGSENFSGVAGFGGSTTGTGVFGLGGGSDGTGVRGIGAGGPNTAPQVPVGVYGQGAQFAEGVVGVHGPGPSPSPENITAGVHGISSFENAAGVMGETTTGVGVWGFITAEGGVAGRFEGPVEIFDNLRVSANLTVNQNLTVLGVKSAAVPFPDGSHHRLYCMESPESWFEDFGIGHLANGQAEIKLEAGFASIVNSDNYHVFLTEYDDNNALYICDRRSKGFTVRAKSSKTARSEFSYRVVAKRKDIVGARLEQVEIPTREPRTVKMPTILERPPLAVRPSGSEPLPRSKESDKR